MSNTIPQVTLNNGVKMPQAGLGVMFLENVQQVIASAVEAGYRLFDNAALYGNEAEIGAALKNNGIPREDVFLSTKLRNSKQSYRDALSEFDLSCERLGVDYLDLYLIHWPCPAHDKYLEAWGALEELYDKGLVRAIGVSNFHESHLRRLLDNCRIKPVVNQLECNPYLSIKPLREFCHANEIWPESWFPLGGPSEPAKGEAPDRILLEDPLLLELGGKYGKTAAQIALRWQIQENNIIIPKSSRKERLMENISLFDFCISASDMARLSALDCGRRVGPNPDTCNDQF